MILITGATGLVGSHLLASLLQTESSIRAIYRTESKINETKERLGSSIPTINELWGKIEWIKADITDIPALTEAFKGISFVYHCAGFISYDVRDYQKLRKINIEGTANVVNLALDQEVKKLCHVSSIAALGSELNNRPITEESPWNSERAHSNYSISKFGAEMEVWRASQEGLSVVIVNPGIIIGSGNWDSGSGLLFKKIAHGFNYHFPKVTGFVCVEDVVKAMQMLMNSPIHNERFILVGENCSFKEILTTIATALNKPIPRKPLQKWMVALGWIFQSIGNFLFNTKKEITRQSIYSTFKSTYYNSNKIKAQLKFEFTPISEGIIKTANTYLAEEIKA